MTLYLPEVENDYVLEFYNKIAKHFQQTRVYLWPCVKDFLERTDKNDIIGDIGCGSGRYLSYPRNIIGCDLCNNLLQLCNQKDVLVCDAVRLPYRDNCFDKIMCIAMLHHISSLERRKEIVKECLRILKPGGIGIFTVWAYEQESTGRKISEQDTMITWHLQERFDNKKESKCFVRHNEKEKTNIYERYCHMFKKGELNELMTGVKIVNEYYQKSNWIVEIIKE